MYPCSLFSVKYTLFPLITEKEPSKLQVSKGTGVFTEKKDWSAWGGIALAVTQKTKLPPEKQFEAQLLLLWLV